MNEIHIKIAKELIELAKNRQTITYGELCDRINYSSPHFVGAELEKISLITNEKYGFFISALVVGKETPGSDKQLPGNGFYTMYRDVRKDSDIPIEDVEWREAVALLEQKKAYIADLSDLVGHVEKAIAENK